MILNPVERYMKNKGKEEGMKEGKLEVAGNLLDGYFKSLIALNVFG